MLKKSQINEYSDTCTLSMSEVNDLDAQEHVQAIGGFQLVVLFVLGACD